MISVSIPDDGRCLLKVGQKVDFSTPFLEKYLTADTSVPLSEKLQVKPAKIFRYLKKFVGDAVGKNEVIAEKKGMFSTQTVISENEGKIKEINHVEGYLLISTQTQSNKINAYFTGTVSQVTKNEIKLDVKDEFVINLKSVNTDFGGKTLYIRDKSKLILAYDSTNKIMIIESFTNYVKAKAEALGIKGIVSLAHPNFDVKLPNAQVKTEEDYKQILQRSLPYCLVNKNYNKIYFYN